MKKTKFLKTLFKIYGLNECQIFQQYIKFGVNKRVTIALKNQKLKKKITNFLIKDKKIFYKLLKLKIRKIITFSKELKTFRGLRNKLNYPCRGQRTRTNAKTKKRNKF